MMCITAYPKRGRWGFIQPGNMIREPIHPCTTQHELLRIEGNMMGGPLSAKARRAKFALTDAMRHFLKKNAPKGIYKCEDLIMSQKLEND